MSEDSDMEEMLPHSDYSLCVVKSEEYIHTLKFKNFKARYINSLRRQKHQINNEDEASAWRVTIYTDDSDELYQDYLSLECFFQKESFNIENNPNFFVIYLINKNGKEHEIYSKLLNDSDSDCFWNIRKFVKKKYVFDEKNAFLPNDNLTLRIKIYFPFEESVDQPPAKHANFIGFESLFNNQEFNDLKIIVGDKEFYVYKGILATQSPVFEAMFKHNMRENNENTLQITDVNYETMQELLRFLYTGKVNNIDTIASDLFAAADKYEIINLKTMCERILIKELSVQNVISFLVVAEKYKGKILKNSALKFFQMHAMDVIKTENYNTDISFLSPLLLGEIIKFLVIHYNK